MEDYTAIVVVCVGSVLVSCICYFSKHYISLVQDVVPSTNIILVKPPTITTAELKNDSSDDSDKGLPIAFSL